MFAKTRSINARVYVYTIKVGLSRMYCIRYLPIVFVPYRYVLGILYRKLEWVLHFALNFSNDAHGHAAPPHATPSDQRMQNNKRRKKRRKKR